MSTHTYTHSFELPKHPIGTKFIWVRGKAARHEAEVIGYHLELNTDTQQANVQYRIRYDIGVQIMTANVARSTVDMAVIKAESEA